MLVGWLKQVVYGKTWYLRRGYTKRANLMENVLNNMVSKDSIIPLRLYDLRIRFVLYTLPESLYAMLDAYIHRDAFRLMHEAAQLSIAAELVRLYNIANIGLILWNNLADIERFGYKPIWKHHTYSQYRSMPSVRINVMDSNISMNEEESIVRYDMDESYYIIADHIQQHSDNLAKSKGLEEKFPYCIQNVSIEYLMSLLLDECIVTFAHIHYLLGNIDISIFKVHDSMHDQPILKLTHYISQPDSNNHQATSTSNVMHHIQKCYTYIKESFFKITSIDIYLSNIKQWEKLNNSYVCEKIKLAKYIYQVIIYICICFSQLITHILGWIKYVWKSADMYNQHININTGHDETFYTEENNASVFTCKVPNTHIDPIIYQLYTSKENSISHVEEQIHPCSIAQDIKEMKLKRSERVSCALSALCPNIDN